MAFDLNSITKEVIRRAPKGIVYGPPGIGKTTFGAGANGVILDTENGIPQELDGVASRTPYFSTWSEIKGFLDWVITAKEKPPAIVVDTIDWLLRRVEEQVAGTDPKASGLVSTLNKSHGGYGNGKQVLRNYVYQYLLPTLDKIVLSGTSVLLLAHTTRRELTTQEGATTERSMPQIHEDLANVMIEWSDFVGAACRSGDQHILVLQETGQLVAKNRYGINQPVPFTWNDFVQAITHS